MIAMLFSFTLANIKLKFFFAHYKTCSAPPINITNWMGFPEYKCGTGYCSNRKLVTTNADASFTRLSPSKMVLVLCDRPNPGYMLMAATIFNG